MGRKRGDNDDFHADLADDGTPVDIAAVRRDDALIDAISGDGPVTTESDEEYELATLLAGWRAEILAEPLPAGPELDEIVAAVNREIGARDALATGRTRSRTQLRLLRPIAGAAALVAIAVGGAAAVSYSAEPGDPLWGVKEVVFSEQAQSTVARIDTTSSLEQAERAIAAGDTTGAQELLASAQVRSSDVADAGQRDELGTWLQRLAVELSKLVPVPPPPAPPVPPNTLPQTGAATVPQTSDTTLPETSVTTPSDTVTQPSTSPSPDLSVLNEPTTVPSTQPSEPTVVRPTTTPPAPSSEPSTPPSTENPPTTTASASASTTSLEQQSISQQVTGSSATSEVR